VRALVGDRLRRERTRGRFERTQERGDAGQLALGEPGAGVGDVHERAAFPHAEEQGAEVWTAAAALGPAADDALLPTQDLDLAPGGAAAARQVGRVELLGHESFPAVREHVAIERTAVARPEVGQAQERRPRVAEDALEPRA